jgi:hypothetical protein
MKKIEEKKLVALVNKWRGLGRLDQACGCLMDKKGSKQALEYGAACFSKCAQELEDVLVPEVQV